MATYLIQDTTLSSIADAIRAKAGKSEAFTPAQMVSEIENLPTGGDDGLVDFIENNVTGTFENSEISKIRDFAFYNCQLLQSVNLPNASHIGISAFYNCQLLQSVNLSNVSYIGSSAFAYCYSLQLVDLPMGNYIGGRAFYGCCNLLSLYLGSTSVCSLYSSNAFASTPIAGYTASTRGVYGSIYVPASLFESYKTAPIWSRFSSRFVSI